MSRSCVSDSGVNHLKGIVCCRGRDAVVYAQPRLHPWDVAAGALLCSETGAILTRMDGAPFDVRRAGSLLVGTPTAHAEVLEHLRAVGD